MTDLGDLVTQEAEKVAAEIGEYVWVAIRYTHRNKTIVPLGVFFEAADAKTACEESSEVPLDWTTVSDKFIRTEDLVTFRGNQVWYLISRTTLHH